MGLCFFFQGEDGIRDRLVTGVQTCALPISEEVEGALKQHTDVYDTVVTGRPSERWGQEVVAIVQLRDGATADRSELIAEAAKHIARYKLPKDFVFRDHIQRSPSGKADYRWAKEQAGVVESAS